MVMPKGRQTIRRGGSALTDGASMRLWEFDGEPGSTLAAMFERAYEPALAAIGRQRVGRSPKPGW
jgi:hypothetical protein